MSARSSRSARCLVKNSRVRPDASIKAITAATKFCWKPSAAIIDSNAIKSTPASPRASRLTISKSRIKAITRLPAAQQIDAQSDRCARCATPPTNSVRAVSNNNMGSSHLLSIEA
ncbi:hypothetical protein D9M71_694310 [compost metagenome]